MLNFQRLIRDAKTGYNYDYMGYAEYEFGATKTTRTAIASAWINNTIASRNLKFGRSKSEMIDVVAVGDKAELDLIHDEIYGPNKGFLGTDMKTIVGWMGVNDSPNILLFREFEPAILEQFLKPAVEALREANTGPLGQ